MQVSYDPFAAIRAGHRPGWQALHNVLLVAITRDDNGFEQLMVERDGQRHEVRGLARWTDSSARTEVARRGWLIPAARAVADGPRDPAFLFRPYIDQTLLRVPELDDGPLHGWMCEAQPHGFLAPHELIPGEGGAFVPDETVDRTVRVPPEFARECKRLQLKPVEVLEGFIADVVGLQNYFACPRADGFCSNGSDERDLASAWLERAYGMNAIDIDAYEAAEDEQALAESETDSFGMLLWEFETYGGSKDELRTTVEAQVEAQRLKAQAAE